MSKEIQVARFKTMYNKGKTYPSCSGSEYENEYGYVIKENLIRGLEKTGEYNQYERIQMHADECKIENILAKAQVDPTILQNRKGMFMDISEMPKSLAEFKNIEIQIINDFYKLDVETRKKFDNSVDKYVAEYGSEKWAEALGIKSIEEVKEIVEETVKIENTGSEEVTNNE